MIIFCGLKAMTEEAREIGNAIDDGELSLISLNGLNVTYDHKRVRMEDMIFSSLFRFSFSILRTDVARVSILFPR